MNFVLTVTNSDLKKMKEHYKTDLVPPTADYINFMAKSMAVTVTGYNSGKIMFQGPIAESEFYAWRDALKIDVKTVRSKVESNGIDVKNIVIDDESIGSDEVGTGDFFGPIVVVSAYVNKSQIEEITKYGITDSKKMTDEYILEIGPKLRELVTHKEVFLDNHYYNKLQAKGNNMNKIKALMHNRALNELTKFVKCDNVIVDQFASPENYFKYLKDEVTVYKNIHFETKAESKYIAVATASVLARYYFLILWDKMCEDYGYTFLKGASNKVDLLAANIIKEKGENFLDNVAKMNFKNVQKAKNII